MQFHKKELLKFCGPTNYALQNLATGVIFCQHYSSYNDPFEFWTKLSQGIPDVDVEPDRFLAAVRTWGFDVQSVTEVKAIPVLWDNVNEYFDECQSYQPPFEEMRRQMRIACFGSERDNLLMWSHYADGLRGFCVVFDEEIIVEAEPKGYVLDVVYCDSPPNVDAFVYAIARDQDWYAHTAIEETKDKIRSKGGPVLEDEVLMYKRAGEEAFQTMVAIWQQVFATKPSEWKYERERRLLVQTDQDDTAPTLRPFPRNAVKEVVLGERMPDIFRRQILAVMQENYPQVPIKTVRRDHGLYTLAIQ